MFWTPVKVISKGDYNYVLLPQHPNATKNGYVLEHRVIVENYLGRLLTSEEIVHHKNKNKKDNRIENLEVMSLSEHAALHAKKGRQCIEFKCPFCNVLFIKEKHKSIDKYTMKPEKLFFCNKACATKYQNSKIKQPMTVLENRVRNLVL